MNRTPEQRYLDLMKKVLSFLLWPEPPLPIATFNFQRSPLKRRVVNAIDRVLATRDMQVCERRRFSDSERNDGQVWPGYADTMIGLKRLDSLQHCVETVIREQVPGDLIETGVWRGGACIFMRAVLAAYGDQNRRVFVADSFAGLPPPDAAQYPADKGDTHHLNQYLAVSQEEVQANFKKYDLLDSQVVFLKGWFKDTLPGAPIQSLAVMRLDGDMYSSTMDGLNNLYPKLSQGGFCIIDDYALPGCKAAVDEFRASHAIGAEMVPIDWSGTYWRKS
jgi:O-methyltransferase